MNESLMQAKMFSQVWQKELMSGFEFKGEYYGVPNSRTAIYMINQIRTNPNIGKYGNAAIEPCGRAVQFLTRIKFKLTRMALSEKRTRDGSPLYEILAIDNVKNATAPPFRGTELVVHWDGRIEESSEFLVNHAVTHGIIDISGAWFNTPWGKVQGRAKCALLLREHPDELKLEFKRSKVEELISIEEIEAGRSATRADSLIDLISEDENV